MVRQPSRSARPPASAFSRRRGPGEPSTALRIRAAGVRASTVIRAHGHEVELAEVAVERFAHECAELPADRRAAI